MNTQLKRFLIVNENQGETTAVQDAVRGFCDGAVIDAYTSYDSVPVSEVALRYDVAFLSVEQEPFVAFALVARLKTHNSKINVIFISGGNDYESQAIKCHASGFAHKPITEGCVRAELDNLLYPI